MIPPRALARGSFRRNRRSGQFRRPVACARNQLCRGFQQKTRPRWICDYARDWRMVDALRRHARCKLSPAPSTISCCRRSSPSDLRHCGRARRLCRAHARTAGVSDRNRRLGDGVLASASCIMSACRRCISPGPRPYVPSYIVASIGVSIAASAFALWTIDRRPTRPRLFLGAIALGLAISGMHYTAMAGMRLDPLCYDVSRFIGAESALSRNTLALLATVVAFGVSGAFLLSLVPDASGPRGLEAPPKAGPAATGAPTAARDLASTPFQEARAAEPPPAASPIGNRRQPRSGSRRMGGREKSPSAIFTPSAPTPITLMSTTARRNISARFRSARSKRASIQVRS